MGLRSPHCFAVELWLHLLPPQEYCLPSLALGQKLEESPGSLEFVFFNSGAPVLPKAPDPATTEGKADARLE